MIESESVSEVLSLHSEASSRENTFPLTSLIPPSDVRERVNLSCRMAPWERLGGEKERAKS